MSDARPIHDAGTSGPAVRAAASAQVFVADPARPDLEPGALHHLSRVLRLRPGEQVVASDGRGHWCLCAYRGDTPGTAAGALEPCAPVRAEPAPAPALTVAFAPVKGDRGDWVVQKLTELGVDRIVPLAVRRSVVQWPAERAARAVTRLERIAREASAQCRRVWLPEVTDVRTLGELRGLAPAGSVALAQMGGAPPGTGHHVVAVGPEGGWEADELALGYPTVGLGSTVLRAETAAVAAGVLLTALRAGTVRGGGREGGAAEVRDW